MTQDSSMPQDCSMPQDTPTAVPDPIPIEAPPSFLGTWDVIRRSAPLAPLRVDITPTKDNRYRLCSADNTFDELLDLDPTGFNLRNDRMAVSLWWDGTRLFGVHLRDDGDPYVWGTASKRQGERDQRNPFPGRNRPDWRFGKPWKVYAKTGEIRPPRPGAQVVIDVEQEGWHNLRQVDEGIFDQVQFQEHNRTLNGKMQRSIACWGRARTLLFAMVVVPDNDMQKIEKASNEAQRAQVCRHLGLLPFEADSLIRIMTPEGRISEGVAVWGAEEG